MIEPEKINAVGWIAFRFTEVNGHHIDISRTEWSFYQYRIELSHGGRFYVHDLGEANACISGLGYRALVEADFVSGNE